MAYMTDKIMEPKCKHEVVLDRWSGFYQIKCDCKTTECWVSLWQAVNSWNRMQGASKEA